MTTNLQTVDKIAAVATRFTTPFVYDTDSQEEKTWDGTTWPVSETTFMVF